MNLVNATEVDADQKDREIVLTLRNSGASVSGQKMADTLGISRVALWKRIDSLKRLGYRIEGGSKGYRLIGEDVVLPWEFHEEGIHYSPLIASTMDEAWQLTEKQADPASGTMIIADAQMKGRGQQGREWRSPAGGIYLSLILKSQIPVPLAGAMVAESARAISDIVRDLCGIELAFLWPNDLYADGRKAGGILLEFSGSADRARHFVLGLGLNVAAVDLPDRGTTGLRELGGENVRRRDIAARFRAAMQDWSRNPHFEVGAWEAGAMGLGRTAIIRDWTGVEKPYRLLGLTRKGGLRCEAIKEPGTELIFDFGETQSLRISEQEGDLL